MNHSFVCVGVRGALSHARFREWPLSIQSALVMRDNALNVSMCFKGLLLPNKSTHDLVEGKKGILNVKGNLKESSQSKTLREAVKKAHSRGKARCPKSIGFQHVQSFIQQIFTEKLPCTQ